MTTDELKALLAETTPGPWSVPHLAREDVTCNCGYVFAGYGGMGSIATINAAESNRHPWGDDNGPCLSAAKANARLIAQAPALAAEVISLREQKARLREALTALVETHDRENFMRSADFHRDDCRCLRCAFDRARAALGDDNG